MIKHSGGFDAADGGEGLVTELSAGGGVAERTRWNRKINDPDWVTRHHPTRHPSRFPSPTSPPTGHQAPGTRSSGTDKYRVNRACPR